MKALTLYQPWCAFLLHGIKRFETRSWPPPAELLGQRIAIHASRTYRKEHKMLAKMHGYDPDSLPTGTVVATADLAGWSRVTRAHPDVVQSEFFWPDEFAGGEGRMVHPREIGLEEVFVGDFSVGRWAYALRNIRPTRVVGQVRGYQKFWNFDPMAHAEPTLCVICRQYLQRHELETLQQSCDPCEHRATAIHDRIRDKARGL